MIPDSVRSLAEIHEMPGQDEQLVHAVSLLDFLTAVSPSFGRDDDAETLGAAINRQQKLFSQIADLNFALRVRNKIIHPRPANADDPDLYPAAVRRAAAHVLAAIEQDVSPHVPPQIREVLLPSPEKPDDGNSETTEASDIYVAGWRYETATSTGFSGSSGPYWRTPIAESQRGSQSPGSLAAVLGSMRSMSSGKFWGLMSCIPPALMVFLLLGSKLSSLLPGNLLVHGALLFLGVTAFRWLRPG